jgi:hypothetical protein
MHGQQNIKIFYDTKIKKGTKQRNSKTREVGKIQNHPSTLQLGS